MFFYEEILREFQKEKVRYVIVGGMALNLLGAVRNTLDMDILVDMEKYNLLKVIKILRSKAYFVKQPVNPEDFANPEIRKDWIKNKHMKAFNFYKSERSFEEIDIIIESPIDYKRALKNIQVINIKGLNLPVVSIDDLIIMKRASGRDQDKLDIEILRKIKKVRNEK